MARDPLTYQIVHTVLVGLMFLVGLCLCCLSFCFARKKGDKERVGFIFVKVAWPLFQLYALFDVVAYILNMTYMEFGYGDRSYGLGSIPHVASQIANTAAFLSNLTNIFVFLAIVRLGVGVLRAQEEDTARVPKWPRFVGWAAYAAAGLIGILSLALWAFRIDAYIKFFSFNADLDSFYYITLATARRLEFAIIILFFVLALLTLCWTCAVLILTKHKAGRQLSKPAIYLIVIAVLWLMVQIYNLAEFADYYDVSDSHIPDKGGHLYTLITSAILNFGILWTALILLIIVSRIHDYSGGLWSTAAINAPYWQPGAGPYPPPPVAGGVHDPSKTTSMYGYPQQMQQTQYNNGYQTGPQQAYGMPTGPQQHLEPSPPSHNATPAHETSTPPMDAAGAASSMPPRIPSPTFRSELPLTHPPTEWELPAESSAPKAATAGEGASGVPVSDAPVSDAPVSNGVPRSPKPVSGSATPGPSNAVPVN